MCPAFDMSVIPTLDSIEGTEFSLGCRNWFPTGAQGRGDGRGEQGAQSGQSGAGKQEPGMAVHTGRVAAFLLLVGFLGCCLLCFCWLVGLGVFC